MRREGAEFLAALRDVASRCGALLVFDEVITLRVAEGGAQAHYGVTPDLTAMGKIIGGGLPIGAFGGRRDVLERFDPDRPGAVFHASTFSGNPLSMAAGLAAMERFTGSEIERLNGLGARLRAGFEPPSRERGCADARPGSGPSRTSTSPAIRRAAPATPSTQSPRAETSAACSTWGLLRRGVFAASRLMFCCSTPMHDADVDAAVAALEDSLRELRPLVATRRPELLG